MIIDDRSGRVLEQWTGFQVAWTMARGYPGAFGEHVNALYIWLPLCLLFLLPFFDFRRPLVAAAPRPARAAVVLGLAGVLQPRPHLRLGAARLPAAALPARADARAAAPAQPRGAATAARPAAPARAGAVAGASAWSSCSASGSALNVTDSNVIDVGYAGVIGAQRIADGRPLYGGYPADNEHGDTYGPVNYEAYVPFEQIFGWSGTLGRPARRARGGDLLRPARGRAAVPARPAHARPDARRRARLRVGLLSRSRCSRSRATPTTRSSRCWCSRRCSPPATRSTLARSRAARSRRSPA